MFIKLTNADGYKVLYNTQNIVTISQGKARNERIIKDVAGDHKIVTETMETIIQMINAG